MKKQRFIVDKMGQEVGQATFRLQEEWIVSAQMLLSNLQRLTSIKASPKTTFVNVSSAE